ncbi:response regulator [Nitrosopumilus sp.]|uniref:TackOD1 domain-containing metal-binding protein n=1 Tax=Nitrosopumilus sp. TaxID=2024843 RepID=UPI002622996A|nr:response regulator [Nitrosopumilus sp.]
MRVKHPIVIVEDSPAIGMVLKNYLEKLGYDQIHTCDTGSSAMTTFSDLVSQKLHPIVLLDYMLPDMDARSLLTQILEIQPDAKVILETATEKSDEGIKELIRIGAYHYIEKPIRFENLKSVIGTIEQEDALFEHEMEITSKSSGEQSSENLDSAGVEEQVDYLLKIANQATESKFVDYVGHDEEKVKQYLKKLESLGKVISIGEEKEISCNTCNSSKTSQRFFCPSCKSTNFKLGKLIECYDCGNISDENTYSNNKCPQCSKELKALGVDYRIMNNHYICNDCKDFFPEISSEYLCLKCENIFSLEEAKWKTSKIYKLVNTK